MEKTKFRSNQWKIITAIILIIVAGFLSWGIHMYSTRGVSSEDKNAENVASQVVTAWYSAEDNTKFENTCKSISTKDFIEKKLSALKNNRGLSQKYTLSIKKTFLIDKRESMEEAVVYYTVKEDANKYDSDMQANIILYKEGGSFKIQNIYLMERSDAPIPETAAEIEKQNSERYLALKDIVNPWIETRNTGDMLKYLSFFSDKAPAEEYKKAFETEQDAIKTKNLKFSVDVAGVFVTSASDKEAQVLVLINQVINGKKYSSPLYLSMTFEGSWKISSIMQSQTSTKK